MNESYYKDELARLRLEMHDIQRYAMERALEADYLAEELTKTKKLLSDLENKTSKTKLAKVLDGPMAGQEVFVDTVWRYVRLSQDGVCYVYKRYDTTIGPVLLLEPEEIISDRYY
jgi:hypothetical protein